MRFRVALGAVLLATTAFAPAPEQPPADADGFVAVTDWEPTGDWGGGGNNAAVGDALGQDLEAGYIRLADDVYTFRIDVTSLPAVGGTPEVTRYGWSFTYNGASFELDGKFTNYSRGACDPTSGQCPPPRDPGPAPFLLRGDCTTNDANVTTCRELASVSAAFDPGAGTIDIPVPAELLAGEAGVQECDRIGPDASLFGASVWAAPAAFVTSSGGPNDSMFIEWDFVVPSSDPENEPCL